MVKKLIQGIGLFALCLLASTLPVHAAEKESVALTADGNTAEVSLVLPETEGNDEVVSLQLGIIVGTKYGEADKTKVSFQFDEGITSAVKTYRYHEDTGYLNIYISGKQNLYENGTLKIGNVVVDSSAELGVTASVAVAEDGIKTVNAAYSMQESDVNLPQPVEIVVGNGGKTSAAGNGGTDIKASETITDKVEVVDKVETVKKAQNPKVTPASLSFTVGEKAVTLKVSKAYGSISYKSSNSKVVKVTSKGKVTPKVAGKAVITVKAAGNATYNEKSIKVKVTVKPKRPAQVTKVAVAPTKSGKAIKVTWGKKANVTGYQIRYAYSKNMSSYMVLRVNKAATVSKTIKNLTSGKYAYVQVRAYKTEGGVTNYGKWSKKVQSIGKIN